jgi:hypothetical protein
MSCCLAGLLAAGCESSRRQPDRIAVVRADFTVSTSRIGYARQSAEGFRPRDARHPGRHVLHQP